MIPLRHYSHAIIHMRFVLFSLYDSRGETGLLCASPSSFVSVSFPLPGLVIPQNFGIVCAAAVPLIFSTSCVPSNVPLGRSPPSWRYRCCFAAFPPLLAPVEEARCRSLRSPTPPPSAVPVPPPAGPPTMAMAARPKPPRGCRRTAVPTDS